MEFSANPNGTFRKTIVYKVNNDGSIEFSGRYDETPYSGLAHFDDPGSIEIRGALTKEQHEILLLHLSRIIKSLQ